MISSCVVWWERLLNSLSDVMSGANELGVWMSRTWATLKWLLQMLCHRTLTAMLVAHLAVR